MSPDPSVSFDFSAVGGTAVIRAGADPADPDAVTWNFGLAPPTPAVAADAGPPLYDRFPNMQGRWDGTSTVNLHEAVRRTLGGNIKAQFQPSGTCGGRAGSRVLELLQCGMIATGKRATFKYVSHAWIYYMARREYHMLGAGDGVPDGSVPPILAKYGALNRDESADRDYDGPQSDNLAVRWGDGRLDQATAARFLAEARDNLVTAQVKVRSAQEFADGLAGGGAGIISDMQGYTMTRDADGACSPRGQWAHYHAHSGIKVTPRGRKLFAYDQSWGATNPGGPPLEGWPSNCFGVDFHVMDEVCRRGSASILFAFDLWDLEQANFDIPWSFS